MSDNPRVVYHFTIPAKILQEAVKQGYPAVYEFSLRAANVADETAVGDMAAGDPARAGRLMIERLLVGWCSSGKIELRNNRLVTVPDTSKRVPLSHADLSSCTAHESWAPKVRQCVITAYKDIHQTDKDDEAFLLGSKSLSVE